MSQQELELPQGWAETTVEHCVNILDGKRIPINSKERAKRIGKIPYYGATGQTGWINDFIFNEELVLIGEDGAPFLDFAKDTAYVISGKSWVNNHAHVVRAIDELTSNQFLCHYLNIFDYHEIITGTTRMKLNQSSLKKILVQLPPINEQKRIVSKIEELFSKIDYTKQSLEDTKLQLEKYRQSLLKSAFEGKLTEGWRQKHTGKIGSVDDFINLIKKANNEKNQDFLEIPREFLDKARDLPNEWRWISLANLGDLNRGKSKHRPRNDPILFGGKYPFIQTGVVRNSKGRITSFKQTYNEVGLAQSKLFPTNTICITIAANIADTSVLTFPACFPDSVVGYNGFSNLIENMFMFYYIQSVKSNLEAIAPSTAQKNINLDILQKMLVPIMSNEEQKEIVSQIEQGFTLIENTTQIVESSLQNLQTMKMSILKQAFEGKLVPQDPNDEPASVLLERIKSTKESQSTKQRGMKHVK